MWREVEVTALYWALQSIGLHDAVEDVTMLWEAKRFGACQKSNPNQRHKQIYRAKGSKKCIRGYLQAATCSIDA